MTRMKTTNSSLRILVVAGLLLLLSGAGIAQKEFKNLLTQTIRVTTDSTRIRASIIVETHEVKTSNDKYYFSYKGGEIKRVRGMVVGKILDGDFSELDEDNNVLIAGRFDEGLKDGEWKKWYPNGELREVAHWNKGVQSGTFTAYSLSGELVQEGEYDEGKKHGVWKAFDNETAVVSYYDAGIKVDAAPKKRRCEWCCKKSAGKTKKEKPAKAKKEKPVGVVNDSEEE